MAQPAATEKTGKCLPLCLTRALQKTVPKIRKERRHSILQKVFVQHGISDDSEKWNLTDFLLQHPLAAQQLQQTFNIRWVIVKKQHRDKVKDNCLVYDGRHAIVKDESSPIHYFLLDKNNVLKQHAINSVMNLPHLSQKKYKKARLRNQKPLWQLLGLSTCVAQDPQTTDELETFLKQHTPPQTQVRVHFLYAPFTDDILLWTNITNTQDGPVADLLELVAWTQNNYDIVYSPKTDHSLAKVQKRGKETEKKFARYQEKMEKLQKKEKEMTDPFQSNCAASINLAHSGLNLAYHLGLIKTKQELSQISNDLVKTHSSLYVFLDEQHHLRHITYYDYQCTFSTQVTCPDGTDDSLEDSQRRDKAAKTMLEFWKKVWDQRQQMMEKRQQLLDPLLERLNPLLHQINKKPIISPYLRCWANLKKLVGHQRVYMFSNQDAHLHSIKFYLTDFVYQTFKKSRGVTVKASSDSTLTMLCIPGMTVINLHTYFDSKTDADFFSTTFGSNGYNPSAIVASHKNKHLERQPYATDRPTTLLTHCKKTGIKSAQHILEYWANFGLFLLTTFFFDVHGLVSLPSASYLAFQCVWTAYTQMAGPLAQGLEKCKAHYEKLLRQDSKGGFMFSVEEALKEGDALWAEEQVHAARAQSIAEMDLVSAYGYAASKTYMPSGFCTGYGKSQEHSDKVLFKLDSKARHKSFEFRAVYKVLHDLVKQEGIVIRTVYSNYSPLGLFCLGSYPIDLAVVTQDGKLLLYQMDGLWAHGCPICPDQPFLFVNGQTHQQVRQKTNQRDKTIKTWVETVNTTVNYPMIDYTIIYDCHTNGFTTQALEYFYSAVPELAQLVQGYQVIDAIGTTLGKKTFDSVIANHSNASYTFIAKATVRVQISTGNHTDGPLVVYQSRTNKYTKQSLAYSGAVVLTRDYYEWLKTSFQNVSLDHLEWVLFYKTEPIFNGIYNELTRLRSSSTDPVLVCFLKRMINLSCGFYGAHTSQQDKATYRLVDGLPRDYAFFRHNLNLDYSTEIGQKNYILLETKTLPKVFSYHKPSNSAIPMFVTIVEYGKLRLVQILHFLQQHVNPLRFRLLYSNIDNILFALGDANTLEEAIEPHLQDSFCTQKGNFLASVENGKVIKTPGMAALEWIRDGTTGWKFVSIRTQHYCLVVSNPTYGGNLHKTSGWANVSSQKAYDMALNMLKGKAVAVNQTRRVNKKFSMDTREVTFHYNM